VLAAELFLLLLETGWIRPPEDDRRRGDWPAGKTDEGTFLRETKGRNHEDITFENDKLFYARKKIVKGNGNINSIKHKLRTQILAKKKSFLF
jgi:hypothetical protein